MEDNAANSHRQQQLYWNQMIELSICSVGDLERIQ
jgi:hypothetical protein